MAWSSRSRRYAGGLEIGALLTELNESNNSVQLFRVTGNGPRDRELVDSFATYELARDAMRELELKQLTDRATSSKRQVYPIDEIAHLWMHQVVPEARNAGKNFYFEGATIYSYGPHFPIAKHYTVGKRKAILLTTKKYSNTTSKHIHNVRMAIPNEFTVFHVPYIVQGFALDFHRANVRSFVNLADDSFAKAKKSIVNGEQYLSTMQNAFDSAKAYIKFFNLKGWKLALPASKTEIEALRTKLQARAEKREQRERWAAENPTEAQRIRQEAFAKRNAEAMAQFEADRAEWLAGTFMHGYPRNPAFGYFDKPTAELRIKDNQVETSQGVKIPIDHAWRGLRLVRAVMRSGKEYKRNGHTEHLGPYAVDSISVDGTLRAGCHVITWEAINRIAPALDRLQEIEMIANSGKDGK
jgi:hypothetical protein